MNYPLLSEYVEAIRSAEDNFDKLSNLRPVFDNNGNPVISSGNFAVVFKMKDGHTGKLYAVKCFTKEQAERKERYVKISEELKSVSSPYILHFEYMERELFVGTSSGSDEEFPVLVMDWVEGQPLDAYIRSFLYDKYALQMLAYRFCKMGAWLLSQPFSHGDLKPDNILVRKDGTLVLVDYDGMYVPAMKGMTANELGSPDFRHPLRTEKDFNEHIDDLSIASIALSLKAISLSPELYGEYASADRLLFSAADYRDIGTSATGRAIMSMATDTELSTLVAAFLLALAQNNQSAVSFRMFLLREPEEPKAEILSTEITGEERQNAITDEFGAKYTADGMKLISAPSNITTYAIKVGTRVIGENSFKNCWPLQSVYIPDSVVCIGSGAFQACHSLQSVYISTGVTRIEEKVFYYCDSLKSVHLPENLINIDSGAFLHCHSLQGIDIPAGVTRIGSGAFQDCHSLKTIDVPAGVTSIEAYAFDGCNSLQSIHIPMGTKAKMLELLGNEYKDKLIEK